MSAPDTNLAKQRRRHRGPLWGIIAALSLVAILFIAYLAYSVDTDSAGATGGVTSEAPTGDTGTGLPAEGAPTTPMTTPDAAPGGGSAPQVIEPQPAPPQPAD